MRLGLTLGSAAGAPAARPGGLVDLDLVLEAERLGFDSVWAAEAYGSDAVSVLAWVAARTERIDVGSAVLQVPARSPAMTAMTAASLDALSGGRFRLGLGVSGPQVSEGWHGVRFDHPLERTREYVDVVRMALAREELRYAGRHVVLPLPDGPGKALRLALHPVRPRIPLYLAAVGPRNLRLAGEVADGWLAVFLSPEHARTQLDAVREGRRRAGHGVDGGDPLDGFDVVAGVPVVVEEDVEAAAAPLRAHAALYLGGMGSRDRNFYAALATRMGFGEAAARVQDLFLARRHREAAAAVPLEFVDATSLLGGPGRLRERVAAFAAAGVTTLAVTPAAADRSRHADALRVVADTVADLGAPVGGPGR
jgi:F420-dependent oxidoreductase-like protein